MIQQLKKKLISVVSLQNLFFSLIMSRFVSKFTFLPNSARAVTPLETKSWTDKNRITTF